MNDICFRTSCISQYYNYQRNHALTCYHLLIFSIEYKQLQLTELYHGNKENLPIVPQYYLVHPLLAANIPIWINIYILDETDKHFIYIWGPTKFWRTWSSPSHHPVSVFLRIWMSWPSCSANCSELVASYGAMTVAISAVVQYSRLLISATATEPIYIKHIFAKNTTLLLPLTVYFLPHNSVKFSLKKQKISIYRQFFPTKYHEKCTIKFQPGFLEPGVDFGTFCM